MSEYLHITKKRAVQVIAWLFLFYFIFSSVMSYLKASGVEVYIIRIEPSKGKFIFEHIVDDGEHGNDAIKHEIERDD